MKRLKKINLLLLANKLIAELSDSRNEKEHYQSFIMKKNRSEIIQTISQTIRNNYPSAKNF